MLVYLIKLYISINKKHIVVGIKIMKNVKCQVVKELSVMIPMDWVAP